MYDKKLLLEVFEQIQEAIAKIKKRFGDIKLTKDFTDSEAGMEKLDSICMQLIAIGESLKNIDKTTNKKLLKKYTQIEWDKIKGIRDIISHHYFDVDSEVIFDICKNHITPLSKTIDQIIVDLSS